MADHTEDHHRDIRPAHGTGPPARRARKHHTARPGRAGIAQGHRRLEAFRGFPHAPRQFQGQRAAARPAKRRLESPSLVLLNESGEHWPLLRALIASFRLSGPQVHDARIAALCLQHGVRELSSTDRGFSRFPRLFVTNPLIGE